MTRPRAWVRRDPRSRTRWQVVYAHPTLGRSTRGGFRMQADANEWAVTFQAEARAGRWVDPARGDVRLADLATEWLAALTTDRARTRESYEAILTGPNSLLSNVSAAGVDLLAMPVGEITYGVLRAWLGKVSARRGASTVRNNFYVLRSVLDYAVESGRIPANPAARIKGKALPSPKRAERAEEDRYPLTAAEVDRIVKALPAPYDTYARLVAATGLRPEEATALTLGDVDLDAGTVRVRAVVVNIGGRLVHEAKTKTDKSRRTVTLDDRTLRALGGYIAEHRASAVQWSAARDAIHPGDALPLFVGLATGRANGRPDADRLDYSKPMRHGIFYARYWRAACDAAGVPASVRFYDLRHAHASWLVARLGEPGALTLKEIQARLGHSSAVMTLDRYAHAPRTATDRERAALNAALAPATPDNVVPLAGTASGASGLVLQSRRRRVGADGLNAVLGRALAVVRLADGDDLAIAGLQPEPVLAGRVLVQHKLACHRHSSIEAPTRWHGRRYGIAWLGAPVEVARHPGCP